MPKSEEKFKELLDRQEIPYLDIRQDKGQLPKFLWEGGKRVDFIVFLKGEGILAFDAKERSWSAESFDIAAEDAQKLRQFEQLTGIHTYVAFLYAPSGKVPEWRFIDTCRLCWGKAPWVTAAKTWKVPHNKCTHSQDITIKFFVNSLNKNSRYVLTRNPQFGGKPVTAKKMTVSTCAKVVR